jgi:hypothetical protein
MHAALARNDFNAIRVAGSARRNEMALNIGAEGNAMSPATETRAAIKKAGSHSAT